MRNVKTNVTPIITGEPGTISKLFRKYLSKISGQHESKDCSTNLLENYKTFCLGNIIACNINCNYRKAAALHTLQTRFSSGI